MSLISLPTKETFCRLRAGQIGLAVIGFVLVGFWASWWNSSLNIDKLRSAHRTWFPPANQLGVDFLYSYHASRHWLSGGNPYTEPTGYHIPVPYCWPPVHLWLFSWCWFFDTHQAIRIWMVTLTTIACIGAWASWRTRRELGLRNWPLPWVLATVLCSTPITFALERGNWDLLVLAFILISVMALSKKALAWDIVTGLCVALAAWLKTYCGILAIGVLAARRPRALLSLGIAYLIIGAVDVSGTLQHIGSMRAYIASYDIGFHASAHPFPTYWKYLWWGTRLADLPGVVGVAVSLFPGVLWVSVQFFLCPRRDKLLYPYFCWLIGAATFIAPVSNDYNFFFLPLAALAVWDRRDPIVIHVMMAFLLLWWQPLRFDINPLIIFLFKLAGLAAVGLSIMERARELARAAANEQSTRQDAPEYASALAA